MPLKYQSFLDKISCDFSGYSEPNDRVSYRWVFKDLNDTRNFLPRAILLNQQETSNFEMWALSFFETHKQAKERITKLAKSKVEVYRKLGTHIAEGITVKTDGISQNKCSSSGHFNHFEYEDINLIPSFSIIETLIELND